MCVWVACILPTGTHVRFSFPMTMGRLSTSSVGPPFCSAEGKELDEEERPMIKGQVPPHGDVGCVEEGRNDRISL